MKKFFTICGALTGLALINGMSSHALAHGWSATGPSGRTFSRTVTPYNNGGGNVGRTVTQTRPDGQTATGSFSRTVSNGTITDTRTDTGYNGYTASSRFTHTPGQEGSYSATGPNGGTYTASYPH